MIRKSKESRGPGKPAAPKGPAKKTGGKDSWRLDCRYFIGDRPCKFKRTCEACATYSPMGKRILIVKLAAIGDVLRTTPLLRGLKRKFAQSHITWVCAKEAIPLLKTNPFIDRILPFDFSALLPLEVETFDLALGLEKEPAGAALTSRVKAREKKGFSLTPEGSVFPLNKGSEYAFFLGLADDLKFYQNQKTYPELIYEIAGIEYEKDRYILDLAPEDIALAKAFARKAGLREDGLLIGLNTGAGDVFVNKAWTVEGFLAVIEKLKRETTADLILLGGPKEREQNQQILAAAGGQIIDSGCDNTLGQFAARVNLCDLIVTGDTTALHIAIGLHKKVVAIFGPTCAQEIELYGQGAIIRTPLSCAPCYRRSCSRSPNCMQAISAAEVVGKIRELLSLPGQAG
jgi:ADP-heptose:LPS heptosyltransferase